MPLKTVTLYSKPTGCQQCIAMKRSLNKTDIEYTVVDATLEENSALIKELGFMSAPVTLVHDADGNLLDSFGGFRPDKIDELNADPEVRRVAKDTEVLSA